MSGITKEDLREMLSELADERGDAADSGGGDAEPGWDMDWDIRLGALALANAYRASQAAALIAEESASPEQCLFAVQAASCAHSAIVFISDEKHGTSRHVSDESSQSRRAELLRQTGEKCHAMAVRILDEDELACS